MHITHMKLLHSCIENTAIQQTFLICDHSKKNRFSIKNPELQIKQKKTDLVKKNNSGRDERTVIFCDPDPVLGF